MAYHKCIVGNSGGGIILPLTSNGVASASSVYDGATTYPAYKAFDGDDTTRWATADSVGNNAWLKYNFNTPIKIVKHRIIPYVSAAGNLHLKSYEIQGSNNDSSWTTIFSETLPNAAVERVIDINDAEPYSYYRILATSDSYYSLKNISIVTWQMYGNYPYSD